jgi:hypothetical protein
MPSVTVRVDTSDIVRVIGNIEAAAAALDQALVPALNSAGGEMRSEIVSGVAGALDGVEDGDVEDAIQERQATVGDPRYQLEANNLTFPYVVWKTARDEKVCEICGPRDGLIMHMHYANQIFPAHPNCRCTLDPVDIAGTMMQVGEPLVEPALDKVADQVIGAFAGVFGDR